MLKRQEYVHLVTVVGSLSKGLSLNEPGVFNPTYISVTWGLVKNKDTPSPTLRIQGLGDQARIENH